jgi:hypothetical protein
MSSAIRQIYFSRLILTAHIVSKSQKSNEHPTLHKTQDGLYHFNYNWTLGFPFITGENLKLHPRDITPRH